MSPVENSESIFAAGPTQLQKPEKHYEGFSPPGDGNRCPTAPAEMTGMWIDIRGGPFEPFLSKEQMSNLMLGIWTATLSLTENGGYDGVPGRRAGRPRATGGTQ
jgi:hypothetical protein